MKGAKLLRANPEKFGKIMLGADLWSTQREIVQAIAQHRRVAVKACHASGKTFAIAVAVLWWLVAHRDGIAVTTAPTWVQVEKVIWGEIRRMISHGQSIGRLLLPVPNRTEVMIGPGNYALGLSTDDSMRFQGFHSGKVLVVLDEAPGVRGEIYEAVEGISAGGDVHVLALGNPVIAGGPFYDAFTTDRSRWKTFTIDAFETPNLHGLSLEQLRKLPRDLPEDDPMFAHAARPYLITRRWVYEAFCKYGEDSPFWQARVRGEFPEQAEDALISLKWIDAARDRRLEGDNERLVYAGIDVAAGGADETVCVVRTKKGRVIKWGAWYGHSTGPVIDFLRPYKDRLEEINYDSAGPGEYFDRDLDHAGFPNLNAVNVGEASQYPDRFKLLKAQLYWELRERFKEGSVSGINDELMISQLASLRFEINPRGQVEMEGKDSMKKRGLKSPDRAEALMLCFANQTPAFTEHLMTKFELENRQAAHDRAVVEARNMGLPAPEPMESEESSFDELMRAYDRGYARADPENTCQRCGGTCAGMPSIVSTNGMRYHLECEPKQF